MGGLNLKSFGSILIVRMMIRGNEMCEIIVSETKKINETYMLSLVRS